MLDIATGGLPRPGCSAIAEQRLSCFPCSDTSVSRATDPNLETFIARTACDSRKMCKTCAEALSGPLSHLSPKLCENCARTTFAQFLRKKWGSRTIFAHFSESPETQKKCVPRTIFTHFSQPGAIFSKSAAVQDRDVSTQIWACDPPAQPETPIPKTIKYTKSSSKVGFWGYGKSSPKVGQK